MSSDRVGSRGFRFIPRVEGLEDRTVPSGNVHSIVAGGVLYVAGDDAANQIWIAGAGKSSVVIRALDSSTTINGRAAPLMLKGINHGYYINMAGGDDFLLVTGTRSNGPLNVNMGEGNNNLGIADAQHRRETVINSGAGTDTITITASGFRRAVFINTGAGDDQVSVNHVGAGDFWMLNPAGNDFFDNQASTLAFPNITGFASGTRPTPPAPPTDTTPPTATLTTTAPSTTKIAPLTFAATFSKPVTGFSATGVQVTNGTVTSFTALDPQTYTFQVTPTDQGVVSAMVLAGAATDATGNANLASDTVSRTFDSLAPTLAINSQTTKSNTPTITGTVDDPTATVKVTVNNQTLNATVTGNTWAAKVLNPLPDFSYSVTATATDPVGNSRSITSPNALTVDATAPTINFSASPGQITNASTVIVTMTFSENVTGFSASDINVGNITNAGNLNFQTINAKTYTIDINPDQQGNVAITIAAGAAQDAAGNGSDAASFTITSDTSPPAGTINTTGQTTITGTASDSLSGVQSVAISIFNGTLYYSGPNTGFDTAGENFIPVSTTDNFANWSFQMPFEGTFTVRAKIIDNAGNQTIISQTVTVDNTAPTVGIDDTPTTTGAVTGTAGDTSTGVTDVSASVFDGTNYLTATGFDGGTTPVFLHATSTTGSNFATWSLAVPAPGTYDVTATATDAAGNTTTTPTKSVTVS